MSLPQSTSLEKMCPKSSKFRNRKKTGFFNVSDS